MDLKKYDVLRNKIKNKDFEGKNKSLDKWLYRFSFFGNFGSIFFAYFLIYPSLYKAISLNLVDGIWSSILSFIFTVIFLTMFEIVKRYLIRNFSHDFSANSMRISVKLVGWFMVSVSVTVLSFYLSINGSRKLAESNIFNETTHKIDFKAKTDSLSLKYDNLKKTYQDEIVELRNSNKKSREIQASTNNTWIRTENDKIITNNEQIIASYEMKLDELTEKQEQELNVLKSEFSEIRETSLGEELKIIYLFIIIVIFNEFIIIGGVYFREYFEYKLYLLNQDKYEKIYNKRDRFKYLLMFVYGEGKLKIGDRVIPGLELKTILKEKTTIQNSSKLVDEFMFEMDRMGVFSTTGKRRFIAVDYNEALETINNYDDTYRLLQEIK